MIGKQALSALQRLSSEPLQGIRLAAVTLAIWIAGAVYCSGYERLSSGLNNWPASLLWSAVAILPWLALFEWSKSEMGRRLAASPARLACFLAATGAGSILLDVIVSTAIGTAMAPLPLSWLRRLPAAGACLLLILWSRGDRFAITTKPHSVRDETLVALAHTIDWIKAADNYIELHQSGRAVLRRMTMRQAEQELTDLGFVRIHRRYLVHRGKIATIAEVDGSRVARLQDGTELPVGTVFAANLGPAL